MMTVLRAIAGCLILGAAALNSAQAALINGIEAVVHDSVITRQEVQDLTASAIPVLRRQYPGQDEVILKKLNQAEKENLDQLMQRQLILHEFKTSGYNLPESVLDDLVEERIRQKFGDRSSFTKSLHADGISFETYREHLREQYILEAMRHKFVSSVIIISPQKVENYYQAHKEEFKVEDKVKLRMIELIKTGDTSGPEPRKMAEEIVLKLKEGAPFTELAAIYSQRAQKNGGEWYEKTGLRQELAAAVANLKAGESSGVIETADRYYLVNVEEATPAHFEPLNEVRSRIENTLIVEEQNRLEKQWVERLKKKTFVRQYWRSE